MWPKSEQFSNILFSLKQLQSWSFILFISFLQMHYSWSQFALWRFKTILIFPVLGLQPLTSYTVLNKPF